MSSNKKKPLKILAANAGCGCGRPKLSDVYEPGPMARVKTSTNPPLMDQNPCSTSSSWDRSGGFSMDNEDGYTSTTISLNVESNTSTQESEFEANPKGSKIINSVAIVKESNDPFQDFKHSMLQMIFQKEIYSKDDLQDLLNRFLELNSPCHHGVIVQAFTEIWNEVISKRRLQSQKPCVAEHPSHES